MSNIQLIKEELLRVDKPECRVHNRVNFFSSLWCVQNEM